jgi:glycosyltransferase involved in cell wall biosynthesis
MSTPLISVLIPCYNAGRFLGETLESVFQQSWPNIEVVVVNDGSTDNSVDVVRRFSRPNLIFLDQNNRGAAASRNRAFAACHGEYIQFLDADDLISERKLELQVRRLGTNPARCVASSEWGRFYSNDPRDARMEPEPVWRDMDSLDWLAESDLHMLFPALWLIPRDIAVAAGPWNERLTLSDDLAVC